MRSYQFLRHRMRQAPASLKAMFCVFILAAVTVFAAAHGTLLYGAVPQGGSGTFQVDGSEDCASDGNWEIGS